MSNHQAVGNGRNMYYEGQFDAEEPADTAVRLALVKERDALRAAIAAPVPQPDITVAQTLSDAASAIRGLLANIRNNAPQLSGKTLGDAEAALLKIAAFTAPSVLSGNQDG